MDLRDITGAVEDLSKAYAISTGTIVHIMSQDKQPAPISGFDLVRGRLFIIGEDGQPAVSNREYERLVKEHSKLYQENKRLQSKIDRLEGYKHSR